jgi:AraC family transcriptional regulator
LPNILPAGQHYGTQLQSWSSDRVTVRRIIYDDGMRLSWHGNEQSSVVFVETGHCTKQLGSRIVELSQNSGLFIPSEGLQRDSFPCATTFLAAEFSAAFLDRLRESGLTPSASISFAAGDTQQLRTQMLCELMNPDSMSAVVLEGLFMSAIGFAHRREQNRASMPPHWLKQAKDLLHDTATETITMEGIACSVEVHPAHLSREFKRWFHRTPGEYVRECRVDLAKKQLRETDSALAQIAFEAGFADHAHFSNVFRRHTGLTPLNYRRQFKSRVGHARQS